jgi:esterase/lipase superfamily enzyme
MARFELRQGDTPTLILSGSGCEALHLTVRGLSDSGTTTIRTARHDTPNDEVHVEEQFTFDELQPYRELEVDPVLYGKEGARYTLTVALRNASDAEPTVVGTATGTLVRSRISNEPAVTGSDAPLVCVELSAVYRAAAAKRKNGGRRDTGAVALPSVSEPPAPKPASLDDLLDLSDDFPLGSESLRRSAPSPAPSPAARSGRTRGAPGGASTAIPAVPKADDDAKHYPVWYGTNRKPIETDGKLTGYSAFRDQEVHYGRCTVRVPKSHKIGEVGSKLWKRLATLTDDRLTLVELLGLERDRFWKGVADQLRAADVGSRHAVVFVHGYNVSFQEAAIRAAQIGCDLSIEGAMAFYSWPSRGTLDGYFADEATIQYSARYITAFLEQVAELAEAEKVHVIAHSMGNRAALEAVRELVARAEARSRVPFSQFVLAAPDVDADYFQQFAEAYRKIAKRTTMYVSDHDHAVRASRFLHGGEPRVGLAPPFQLVPGIDTIFAGKVDESILGHGYVAAAWQLLNDIHQMIHLDADPKKRTWVKRSPSDDHWVLEGVV